MEAILIFNTLAYVLADSDSGGAAAAPLILMLSGFIFYAMMSARYRNADKRHVHEKETSTVVTNLECSDVFMQSRKGLTSATMSKANHIRVEGALNVKGGSKLLDTFTK